MTKENLIQLTSNLYRLTLLFPKKEPLRYKMRELADEILANQTEKDLEILDSFFEVAKAQNWVSPQEILNLQQEYSKLKDELGKLTQVRPVSGVTPVRPVFTDQYVDVRRQHPSTSDGQGRTLVSSMNERQEKILAFLKENGRVQVWQVKQIFPEITKRTLRRDFEFLVKQGKIGRIGERNETFYQLPTNYESKRITNKGRTMS